MENTDFNQKILQIWKKYPADRGELLPFLYPPFQKNSILFIGMNPSSSKERRLENETGIFAILKLSIDMVTDDVQNKIIKHESDMKENYKYYKEFRNLSAELGIKWDHIDLVYYRDTSQKNLAKRALDKNTKFKSKFFEEQFELINQLLEATNPKLILIANALSRKIFVKYYGDKLTPKATLKKIDPNPKTGYHTIKINGKDTPLFFSSMLTGQRALDKGSYYRLIWHMRRAINEKSGDT